MNKRQSSPFVPPNELDRDGKPSKTFREKAHPSPKEFLGRFNPFTNKSDSNSELNRSKQASSEEDSEQKKSQQSSTKRVPFDSPAEPISILVAVAGLFTGTRKRSIAVTHAYSDVYGPYPPGETPSYRDSYSAADVKKTAIDYEHTVKPSKLAVGDSRTLCFTDGKEVVAKRVAKDTYMVIVYDPDRNVLFKAWQWRDSKGNSKRMEVNAVSGEKTVWREGPKFDGYPSHEKYEVNVSADGKTSRKKPATPNKTSEERPAPPPNNSFYGPIGPGKTGYEYSPYTAAGVKSTADQFEDEVKPWELNIDDEPKSKCFTDGRTVVAKRVALNTYTVTLYGPDHRVMYKTWQSWDAQGNSMRVEINAISEEQTVIRIGPKFDSYPYEEKYEVFVSPDGKTTPKQPLPTYISEKEDDGIDSDLAKAAHKEGAVAGAEEAGKQFNSSKFVNSLPRKARFVLKAMPEASQALVLVEARRNINEMVDQGIPSSEAIKIEAECIAILVGVEAGMAKIGGAVGPGGAVVGAIGGGMLGYIAADGHREKAIKRYFENHPQEAIK